MSHEERERVATTIGVDLVGNFLALRSLDKEFAAMVLKVWDEVLDEQLAAEGDGITMAAPDKEAARLIRKALEIFSDNARPAPDSAVRDK